MPLFLDCCSDEVDLIVPPPPPPIPPRCCSSCPTMNIAASLNGGTWSNVITITANCLPGLTYTLERSTLPNGVWTVVGTWTGSPISDTLLPLSQTTYYYRIVISGASGAGCFLNCVNPTTASVTRPNCCALSIQMPGDTVNGFTAPPYTYNSGTGVFTFSFFIVNSSGTGCIASTPPSTITVTNSQVTTQSVTPVGWIGGNLRYQYDVTVSGINPTQALDVNITGNSLCDTNRIPTRILTLPQLPNCCSETEIRNNPPILNPSTSNRLYDEPTSVSLIGYPMKVSIPGGDRPYFGLNVVGGIGLMSTSGSNFLFNDSILIKPVSGTEDEFDIEIRFQGLNNCGGNSYRCQLTELYGRNTCCVIGPSLEQNLTNTSRYDKDGVTANEFAPLLASDDTFWTGFRDTYSATQSNALRVYNNNPTNTILPVPVYNLSNIPQPNPHHYIISMNITGGGTTNPATASFAIPTGVGNCTLTIRFKFHLQKGQGLGAYLRDGDGQILNQSLASYDRYFQIDIVPTGGSGCDTNAKSGAFRLPACNQNTLRGTITGSSGGVLVNARPVNNGGGLDSLTPTFSRTVPTITPPTGVIVREWEQTGSGRANLFTINRLASTTLINTNGNYMYDVFYNQVGNPITDLFINKEAFQQMAKLPYRVSDFLEVGQRRNRVGWLNVPRYAHLISYELAKVVESNFNTIFPLTNTGFWSGVGNGSSPLTGAFTAPIDSFIIDMNLNPIINFLQSRIGIDFQPCCGFDVSSFKLSLVLFSEVSTLAGFMWSNVSGTQMWHGLGYGQIPGLGGNPPIEQYVISPSNLVVEVDLDLVSGTINGIKYRDKVLISTCADTNSHIFSAGHRVGTETTRTTAWRLDDYTINITEVSPNVLRFRNTSVIDIVSTTDRIGIYPLKTPSIFTTPERLDIRRKFIATNLVLTTMNICPEYSTGSTTEINNCNCDYTGTVYNSLGVSPAHIINPRIKGEIVSRPTTTNTADFGNGGLPQVLAAAGHFPNGASEINKVSVGENKAIYTSPYCNILTPSIKLNVLSHRINGFSTGQADFIL